VEPRNEALRIAALGIANAAGDQLLSDDEEDEEEGKTKTTKAPSRTLLVKEDGTYSRG